jgi:hypothetical protein
MVYAKATGVHRLNKYDGGSASGSISQTLAETKDLWNLALESTTFKSMKEEFEIDNQAEEHPSVCLFPLSSYRNSFYNDCFIYKK